MKKIVLITLCLGMLSLPAMADVFDDDKKGFMVGLGIGLTGISTEVDYNIGHDVDEWAGGMVTSFKLGYGFSEQFSLYYTNQVDWYTLNGSSVRVGLTGIGADYYISPLSGLYVTGMLGLGSMDNVTNNGTHTGFGFGLGVGYDLLPHMSVDIAYMSINADEDNAEIDTDSLRVKFNYTWY